MTRFRTGYTNAMGLAPLALLATAIVAVAMSAAAAAAKTQYVREQLKLLLQTALDTGQSYEAFAKGVRELADEQERIILTQAEFGEVTKDATKYIQEQQKEGKTLAQIMTNLGRVEVIMSKETFDAKSAFDQLRTSTLTSAEKMDLMRMRTAGAGDRLGQLALELLKASEAEKAMAEEAEAVSSSLDQLATLVAGPATQAWEAYGVSGGDAIKEMLYNLVLANVATDEMGRSGSDAAMAVGEGFGLLDQRTKNILGAILIFKAELAETGDVERFNEQIAGLAKNFEAGAAAAAKAAISVTGLIEAASGKSFSPMQQWREDIEWFLAGGGEIKAAFEGVVAAMEANQITPAQAHAFFGELMVAEVDLEVEIGQATIEDGANRIAEMAGIGVAEARAIILGSEGIVGALQQAGDTKIALAAFDDIEARIASTREQMTLLATSGYEVEVGGETLSNAQASASLLETTLNRLTIDTEWTLPFTYENMTKGLSEVTSTETKMIALNARKDDIDLDSRDVTKAADNAATLAAKLALAASQTWVVRIHTIKTSESGGSGDKDANLPSGYQPRAPWVVNQGRAGGVQDFVVPPGYYEPQRPYMMPLSSGETVNIQRSGEPRSGVAGAGGDINVYNDIKNMVDIEAITSQVLQAIAGAQL